MPPATEDWLPGYPLFTGRLLHSHRLCSHPRSAHRQGRRQHCQLTPSLPGTLPDCSSKWPSGCGQYKGSEDQEPPAEQRAPAVWSPRPYSLWMWHEFGHAIQSKAQHRGLFCSFLGPRRRRMRKATAFARGSTRLQRLSLTGLTGSWLGEGAVTPSSLLDSGLLLLASHH